MSKLSQLDKAIAAIDADLLVLQMARAKLLQQRGPLLPARKPRAVAVKVEHDGNALGAFGVKANLA